MMKIVSIVLQVVGVSAGALLGLWLKSGPSESDAHADSGHEKAGAHGEEKAHGDKKADKKKDKKKKKKDKGGHGKDKGGHGKDKGGYGDASSSNSGFMKFSRQFIVPVIRRDNVNALVVIDINLELSPSATESAYSREPKIRDALLSALLKLSNEGAFEDRLLADENMERVRAQLLEAAQSILGDDAEDILILSIARQDF